MEIKSVTEPSVNEETKIEGIAESLYRRIQEETEKILAAQLKALGVDVEDLDAISGDLMKKVFPNSRKALAIYEYKGQKILGLRISDNGMAIEFDIPKLETQKEVQNV